MGPSEGYRGFNPLCHKVGRGFVVVMMALLTVRRILHTYTRPS